MTITTSLTKTGRASSLRWMLPSWAESMWLPRGRHHAASTTSLISSGVSSKANSGTSGMDSSPDSSGVAGGKAAHPTGAPWLSRGWTWARTWLQGGWKWVWGWQRGGWKWRRDSDGTGTDVGIRTGTRAEGAIDTARTTEATTTPDMTGRTGSDRGACPFRASTSSKEVTRGQVHSSRAIQFNKTVIPSTFSPQDGPTVSKIFNSQWLNW